jgi:hypothetical protein
MERNVVKTEEDVKFLEDLMKLGKEDIVNGIRFYNIRKIRS